MKDRVVYFHKYRGQIFYVGMGSLRRAKEKGKDRRSKSYTKFVGRKKKKYISVEIVASELSKEEALELESLLIEEIGRICNGTGPLINICP